MASLTMGVLYDPLRNNQKDWHPASAGLARIAILDAANLHPFALLLNACNHHCKAAPESSLLIHFPVTEAMSAAAGLRDLFTAGAMPLAATGSLCLSFPCHVPGLVTPRSAQAPLLACRLTAMASSAHAAAGDDTHAFLSQVECHCLANAFCATKARLHVHDDLQNTQVLPAAWSRSGLLLHPR